MSQCNYCMMKEIKANAKHDNKRVIVRDAEWNAGISVLVVPRSIEIPDVIEGATDKYPNGDAFHKKYFVVWFWEVGNECEC